MYGIKGYIFIEKVGRLKISNPPFEALTGYDKGHEYMKMNIEAMSNQLMRKDMTTGEEKPLTATGYMFLLVPEEEWKEEE